MIPLTREEFTARIAVKGIFYFSCIELKTDVPHYFVIIGQQHDGTLILSCCTSQFNTVKKLIERNKFPNETLVFINPNDPANPFTSQTYINCNEYFLFYIEELLAMYDNNEIEYKGEIPIDSFEQILIGFHKSDLIEDETKDCLLDPEDL